MSGRIVGQVLEHAPEDLRPAEFLVLVAIAEDARDRDRLARFSDVETLTYKSRKGPGTVRNALSELTRRGLIVPTVEKARVGVHQEYRITDLKPEHRAATETPNGTTRARNTPPLRSIQ